MNQDTLFIGLPLISHNDFPIPIPFACHRLRQFNDGDTVEKVGVMHSDFIF